MTPALHYEATLVQADGRWALENKFNYGDSTDLWSAPGFVACTPYTNPNTKWWDGTPSGLWASQIGSSSSVMTFDFGDLPHHNDGSIVSWGDNWIGQCGVPVPNADFAAVAAGSAHSLGLKSDGTIVAWGLVTTASATSPRPTRALWRSRPAGVTAWALSPMVRSWPGG